jgi:hypothetical protein
VYYNEQKPSENASFVPGPHKWAKDPKLKMLIIMGKIPKEDKSPLIEDVIGKGKAPE